jgi:hypothetical protein
VLIRRIFFLLQKRNMGIQKRGIWCWFQIFQTSCKKLMWKSNQRKSCCVQKFVFYNFFVVNFIALGFELSTEFCVLWYPKLFCLYKVSTFCKLWSQNRTKRWKKDKYILKMWPWIPFYICLRSGRLHFVKKVKIVVRYSKLCSKLHPATQATSGQRNITFPPPPFCCCLARNVFVY